MLKLAYSYKDKINERFESIAFDDRYKFYTGCWWDYKVDIADNSWDNIQMTSVDKDDNVIGYFSAGINRSSNKVFSIGALNFCEGVNITFSRDFYQFLDELFTKHNIRKVEWNVIIGNPAEKIYDKLIEKYNGRVVGVRKESVLTPDNILRNEKEYEIFKEDYILCKNKK